MIYITLQKFHNIKTDIAIAVLRVTILGSVVRDFFQYPLQNECFRGYTGISLSVCLSVSLCVYVS